MISPGHKGDLVIVSVPASVLRAEQPLPPWERLRPHYAAGQLGCGARRIAMPSIASLGSHEGGEFFFRKIKGHRVLGFQPTAANRASATTGRGRR
jgi:hypothetical protein